ncbi:hypothetical protein TRIATDRAFT_299362 [Trichoderma atroviride IMI 206040]|uniref:Uncharacterized protein n=1 Tax=Hypocrea atroviridis (strain ATCC 20476 / IMI 206040) TaxID=452589 RepID=G9NUJ0_HYPAI|nr:uncharacterized protein TRIATDRAFT_299362 [Trichoderma atroviride IMI 206040]EHK45719.1 hypothetical protein TRIATDRAFT_299362 [Trichoderma atroviride IMI 206040]
MIRLAPRAPRLLPQNSRDHRDVRLHVDGLVRETQRRCRKRPWLGSCATRANAL